MSFTAWYEIYTYEIKENYGFSRVWAQFKARLADLLYIEFDIMKVDRLEIHAHAGDDLEKVWRTDPECAAEILVVLEQLKADPKFIDILTTRGNVDFGETRLNIKVWEKVKKYTNLWRFRILDNVATSYRIVYGYDYRYRLVWVLAIVHKKEEDFSYDDLSAKISRRILSDWANH